MLSLLFKGKMKVTLNFPKMLTVNCVEDFLTHPVELNMQKLLFHRHYSTLKTCRTQYRMKYFL